MNINKELYEELATELADSLEKEKNDIVEKLKQEKIASKFSIILSEDTDLASA